MADGLTVGKDKSGWTVISFPVLAGWQEATASYKMSQAGLRWLIAELTKHLEPEAPPKESGAK